MAIELRAPTDKTRVVGIDLIDRRDDYLVGDYKSQDEAFKVADGHNTKHSGSMDDVNYVYYVYNDQGLFIRGNEAVSQEISL